MMKTEIENAFSVLAMRGIKLEHEFLIVDENDFVKIFSAILDKITNESNRCIIVEIVGGLRIVCLALLMVTIMLPNRIEKVYAIPESSSARVSIPIPFINPQLTHTSRTILREIGKGTKTIDVLSNVLNKDKSTLNRQIRRLVEKGLIGQQRKGRITTYSLTLYGSACLANTHYSA
jgi:CRISPR locus-related DNA-binding protein